MPDSWLYLIREVPRVEREIPVMAFGDDCGPLSRTGVLRRCRILATANTDVTAVKPGRAQSDIVRKVRHKKTPTGYPIGVCSVAALFVTESLAARVVSVR